MNCKICSGSKFHTDWCPMVDGEDVETKGERRQAEQARQGAHPVHGRGLESIMNSIRNRGEQVGRGAMNMYIFYQGENAATYYAANTARVDFARTRNMRVVGAWRGISSSFAFTAWKREMRPEIMTQSIAVSSVAEGLDLITWSAS